MIHTLAAIEWLGLSRSAVVALAAASAVGLLLAHLLRPRPRSITVAFLPLWRGAARRVRRRLERRSLLLVRLAIAALIVAATAAPVWFRGGHPGRGRHVVLLVDTSVSLRARDGARRRWDDARAAAGEVLDSLDDRARVLVAGFDVAPRAVTEFVEPGRARAALDELEPSAAPADLDRALRFADGVLPPGAPAELVVVTDGRPPAARPGLTTIRVGHPQRNVSIAAFSVARATRGGLEARAALDNHADSGSATRVRVRITGRPSPIVDEPRLLPPGRTTLRLALTGVPEDARGFELDVAATDPRDDALDDDSRAYAVLNAAAARRVLVVGERDLYLEGALLGAGVAFDRDDAIAADFPARAARYDVVILDGARVDTPLPPGRYLAVAPTGAAVATAGPLVRSPVVTEARRDDPVLQGVSLADLHVREARRYTPRGGDRVLLAALDVPLLIAREQGPERTLLLAFDWRRSDLPLRPAFPLLLANALDWLAARSSGGLAHASVVGATIEGTPLVRAGIYAPRDGAERIAVNVRDPYESNLRVADASPGTPPNASTRAPQASAAPSIALILGALLLLGVEWWASSPTARNRVATVARAAAVVALLLAAARAPRDAAPRDRRTIVVLVDASADREALARVGERLRDASRAADPTADVRVLRFAGRTQPWAPPFDVSSQRQEREAPDLGAAIARGAGLVSRRAGGAIVLFTTGADAGGWAAHAAADAAARGVPIAVVPIASAPAGDDAGIIGLSVPEPPRPRAPFFLDMTIATTRARDVTIAVRRDGVELPSSRRKLAVVAGESSVRVAASVEDARAATFEAVLVDAADDRPENDRATVVVAPSPPAHVRVISVDPREGASVAAALRGSGFAVSTARPSDVAAAAPGELIVLADVPTAAIGDASLAALRKAVRDGAALIAIGGPDAFEGGGYHNSSLERLLPLRTDDERERRDATLALALVIDRSGSMAGPKLELTKEAARAAAAARAPDDLVSILAFDSQPHTIARLQQAANRQRILGDIGRLQAGGGTNLVPALRRAVDELLVANARRKHVIILSDGQSTRDGLDEIVDDAVAGHVTISTIGVGEGADQALLGTIATRGRGRAYHTTDPESIPRLFSRETAELRAPDASTRTGRAHAARSTDWLAGLDLATAPPLTGWNATRLQPDGEALLEVVSSSGAAAPLLARRREGLGVVVAFATDGGARWATAWTRWASWPRLWTQLARGALGSPDGPSVQVTAERTGDALLVTASARDSAAASAEHLDGEARVRAATDAAAPFIEVEPGRYVARLAAAGARTPLVVDAALAPPAGGAIARGRAHVAAVAPPEARPLTSQEQTRRRTRRAELAAAAHGALFSSGDDVVAWVRAEATRRDAAARTPERRVPLGPLAAAVALLLFVADVSLRRATLPASRNPGRGAVW